MKYVNYRLAAALIAASMTSIAWAGSDAEAANQPMGDSMNQGEAMQKLGFSELDKDQDGYISAVEATGDTGLMENWNSVDTNGDRKIDSTEFSKFETMESQPGAQQQGDSEMPAEDGMQQQNTQEQSTDTEY